MLKDQTNSFECTIQTVWLNLKKRHTSGVIILTFRLSLFSVSIIACACELIYTQTIMCLRFIADHREEERQRITGERHKVNNNNKKNDTTQQQEEKEKF